MAIEKQDLLEDLNSDERKFLTDNVDIYLKPMLIDLYHEKPSDPLVFMMQWLEKNGTKIKHERVFEDSYYYKPQ